MVCFICILNAGNVLATGFECYREHAYQTNGTDTGLFWSGKTMTVKLFVKLFMPVTSTANTPDKSGICWLIVATH
ncbi:hypothetical protein VE30_04200 [Vreelandella aquamarina]|nr:hypothetical protein VE30_04200 [Halomonas meridiana]